MRVVFVNRFFYPDESATAQLLTDLAVGLAGQGWDVHVVCCRQRYAVAGADLPARQTVQGVVVHRVWTTRFGRGRLFGRALDYVSFHVSSAVALFRLLGPEAIVVAKTDPPLICLVAAAVATARRALLVNWLQDVFPEIAAQLGAGHVPGLNALLLGLRDASLRAAAANVVLGTRMAERLRARCPRTGFTIIENWADAGAIRPQPAAASRLRAGLGLDQALVVGYSGNLGRAHDVDTLLGAAELLRSERIAFLLIGGGVNMDALKIEAGRRRLDNFRFLPYQPREGLEDALAAADVHWVSLLPRLEGLIVPSKFYGILAAGRPTLFIGDPDGELARIIRAQGCGMVVEIGDSRGLADALLLMQDTAVRQSMGAAARDWLCARHSKAAALGLWTELLEGVAAAGRQAASPRFRRWISRAFKSMSIS
jgi:glycosyltransferase involved in cell wall biosynthesis